MYHALMNIGGTCIDLERIDLIDNNIPKDWILMFRAIRTSNIDLVKCLEKYMVPLLQKYGGNHAVCGKNEEKSFQMLIFLYENKPFEFNPFICNNAAARGYKTILRWLGRKHKHSSKYYICACKQKCT